MQNASAISVTSSVHMKDRRDYSCFYIIPSWKLLLLETEYYEFEM